jgi:prepilin-type N-terminal cleavage/methylation domain-containing protein
MTSNTRKNLNAFSVRLSGIFTGRLCNRHCRAFTLVEVNMALLVVGIGLAALLGLFPAALRESSLAAEDTTQAMFAEQVFNMMHANAQSIKTWSGWNAGKTNFLANVCVPDENGGMVNIDAGYHTVANYLMHGNYVVYDLKIQQDSDIVKAWMRIADRRNTDITKNPVYYTEFVFMGM